MSLEYGIVTENDTEKELVKAIDKCIDEFFAARPGYEHYKSHRLRKSKNDGGVSYRADAIPWDYEYQYEYFNKPFGVFVELYPNTNNEGGQKFKIDGVKWNLFINAVWYPENCKDKTPPEIVELADFILNGISYKTVLIAEYAEGEVRF